jgi:hypothetical protein
LTAHVTVPPAPSRCITNTENALVPVRENVSRVTEFVKYPVTNTPSPPSDASAGLKLIGCALGTLYAQAMLPVLSIFMTKAAFR